MTEKLCPIRASLTVLEHTQNPSNCTRERCAWWCSEMPYRNIDDACAITIIASTKKRGEK